MVRVLILPIVLLIFCTILLLRITPLPSHYPTLSPVFKSADNIRAQHNAHVFPGHEQFCHTDPGLEIHLHLDVKRPKRETCFGQCRNSKTVSIRDAAVQAPKLLSLCLLNPFHGFYDCLWPLIHYLSSCRPDRPPVIVNTTDIPARRRTKWVVAAREAFLKHSGATGDIIELGSLREGECLCFRSVVRFKKHKLWRPIRFQYRQDFGSRKVLAPHPTMLKRKALQLFRTSVHWTYPQEDGPSGHLSQVLVYGRQDAPRRRWLNVDDFVSNLSARLPPGFDLTGMDKIPETFAEQVSGHSQVDILVAPHGAAMVNTLVMREGSVIVDIASMHCIDLRQAENTTNLGAAMDTTDPNTWVPWHSQSLGLYHLVAPCYLPGDTTGNGDFVTDNETLVNITLFVAKFLRERG